jgi:small ligand-binding sensory domain FIST
MPTPRTPKRCSTRCARWPGVSWVGCVGIGVAASGIEYFDEPALVLLLADLPPEHFQLYSGAKPLAAGGAFSALVHADPATPELSELLGELAQRVASGYLFGGVSSSRTRALHLADGVWRGGLSGVAFAPEVALISRVTQGCQPIGPARRISAAEHNLVLALDDEPALPCLLRDLDASLVDAHKVLERLRATLVGLSDGDASLLARGGQFGADTRVRHLLGVDPGRQGFAVAERVQVGMRLAFCRRDAAAARRDLVRICSEIRDELEQPAHAHAPARIRGALYVSCAGRGGPHFGAPSAELQIVRHALGDVPLAGFFAGGEIARHHLYGYTGVLTVFGASP